MGIGGEHGKWGDLESEMGESTNKCTKEDDAGDGYYKIPRMPPGLDNTMLGECSQS